MRCILLFLILASLAACQGSEAPSTPDVPDTTPDAASPDATPDLDVPDQASDLPPDMEPPPECSCEAPAPSCEDGERRRLIEAQCDDAGICQMSAIVEACDAPPQDGCSDAQTVITYTSAGQCVSGECSYESAETACDAPPAPRCLDDTTLEIHEEVGACADGACSYNVTTLDCGALGCCEGGCCEVTPANSFGPLVATGIVVGPPSGTFDTDTQCRADSVLGACAPVSAVQGADVCVCRVDRIQIQDLTVVGSRALALLALEEIEVLGTLSVAALGTRSGAGVAFQYSTSSSSGAQGGTFGSVGGRSGSSLYGVAALEPLLGGMRGQDACGRSGGGGGGALQLTAGGSVRVVGAIDAGGGGAQGGPESSGCNAGAAGGSGGGVLIEAPSVEMTGVLAANGGGGGSGGSTDHTGRSGSDARISTSPASGGSSVRDQTCALYPDVFSGSGGRGAAEGLGANSGGSSDSETRCIGNTYAGAGGGGGGVGRVRINTQRGAQSCLCNGVFSPRPTFGTLALSAP